MSSPVGDPHLAYELLDAGEYDLVLLDIHLPQLSGDTFPSPCSAAGPGWPSGCC